MPGHRARAPGLGKSGGWRQRPPPTQRPRRLRRALTRTRRGAVGRPHQRWPEDRRVARSRIHNPMPPRTRHGRSRPRHLVPRSRGRLLKEGRVPRHMSSRPHASPPLRWRPRWQRRSTDRATATTRVPGVGATESHFQRLEAGGAAARPRPQPRIRAHPARAQHADGRGGGSRQLEMRWKKQEKS